jgi:hypothetical protein
MSRVVQLPTKLEEMKKDEQSRKMSKAKISVDGGPVVLRGLWPNGQ